MTHTRFHDIKGEVLEYVHACGINFIVYLTLHDLATDPDRARFYGINTICYHFDCWLNRFDDYGLSFIDRFDHKQVDSHLREKFSIGVKSMPYSEEVRLDRTLGVHYSAIGQSNIPSAVDIVLGSFRYAINVFTRSDEHNRAGADALLHLIAPLFPRESDGQIPDLGLAFRPRNVKAPVYQHKYKNLRDYLAAHDIISSRCDWG